MTGWSAGGERRRRRTTAGAAAVLVLLLALAAGCGPPRVTLADLATDQRAHDGEEITVRGVVVEIEPDGPVPHYVVVQDAEANRLELIPLQEAESHIGSVVEVTGEYRFDPDRGRRLRIQTIEPLEREQQPET
jgi:uncharacterized protein (DUF58 family)